MNRDSIFKFPLEQIKDFRFDEQVASVFPDMIKRSIPGYEQILTGIGMIAKGAITQGSRVYDLGCSQGAALLAMRRSCPFTDVTMIGVDNSPAMVDKARQYLNSFHSDIATQIINADITQLAIENASMVVLNFTLQFLPPDRRERLLHSIYQGMRAGAILVLSEKFTLSDQKIDNLLTHLHHSFKRAQGYSELEISQKRTALEKVMRIDSLKTHYHRLATVGFTHAKLWYQCFNFGSIIAIKE